MAEMALLENSDGSTPISIEILPPNRGLGLDGIHGFFQGLGEWKPAFVSVTYHQAHKIDVIDGEGPNNQIWNRKKPGTLGVCAMLKFQYGLKVIPHLICGGFSRFESEDFLVDLDYLGMENVLALRGDPKKGDEGFKPHPEGNQYASELVAQISSLNKGNYLEEVKEAKPTNFKIGVAGYPEIHREAVDSNVDLLNLKHKVDEGASFIITQMFFENKYFFEFVKQCREVGITVPIIPGLKVLTSKRQLEVLPGLFNTKMPESLIEEANACENREQVIEVGVKHALEQARGLLEFGVPCLHFFTMNDLTTFSKVLDGLRS
jgi:methylenetetrahydrofolate reductase (NADPH)